MQICPSRSLRVNHGFSLLEVMLALSLLLLIFLAVSVPLRSRWESEQTRRSAQRVMLTWMKAQSKAFREGREWVVAWDSETAALKAMPLEKYLAENNPVDAPPVVAPVEAVEGIPDFSFNMALDKNIRLLPESESDEIPVVHFFGNGRARHASVLVMGPKKDVWRVRMDWSGRPLVEMVKGLGGDTAPSGNRPLPKLETGRGNPSPSEAAP